MAIDKKTELVRDIQFDPRTCRHTLNGKTHVLHCHHYATLVTQLADDCGMLDGKKLLSESSEDTFFEVLADYYAEHGLSDIADRISIAEQYYAASGLGKMVVKFAGSDSGEVALEHSHLDAGWIKKWGNSSKPVNFITCGYIAGMFSAVFDRQPRSFSVTETESIAAGAAASRFVVVAR